MCLSCNFEGNMHTSTFISLNFDNLICDERCPGWIHGYKYFAQVCAGQMPLTL